MAGITLHLDTLSPDISMPGVYPFKIRAVSDEEGLDSGVFVFHACSTEDALPGDQFECVASYQQMQELPLNEPITDGDAPIPYYRKDFADFYLTDPRGIDEIWNIVQQDISLLMRSSALFQEIGNTATVTVYSTGAIVPE